MIRLTILYNLKPYVDEEEFLHWQLAEYKRISDFIPGLVCADFARVESAWPDGSQPLYRFMATLDWSDRKSFEMGFYNAQVQSDLLDKLKVLSEPVFLISEVLMQHHVVA